MTTENIKNTETESSNHHQKEIKLMPIREISRITGINPATLRAWERRYGLVIPHRTPKGHRMYSQGHIDRINTVLVWLSRGVAISQVRHLIEEGHTQSPITAGSWSHTRAELLACITQLSERQLDEKFNAALALYPNKILVEQLLWPLLSELHQRWQGQFGTRLEQVFFLSWLRSKLSTRVYHCNRQATGSPVLLVNIGAAPMEPGLWLCAWLTSASDCPVEVFDWQVPAGELMTAISILSPRALVLYSDQALENHFISRNLPHLVKHCPIPIIISGAASQIHSSALDELTGLIIEPDPLSTYSWLMNNGLLGSHGASQ